jgi:phosphatidylglycerol lysyltransferase
LRRPRSGPTLGAVSDASVPPAVRDAVLALLRRHGGGAVSFQVLEPGLSYWFDGEEACVAYAEVDRGRAWVAAGGPIAAPGREVEVMRRFVRAARQAGRRVRFFGIERDLSAEGCFELLQVGRQPTWDPQAWPATLARRRSLREQLRRARAKGVRVREAAAAEFDDPEGRLRTRVDALVARWLALRPMAPMQFVVRLAPYEFPAERRFLCAERGGDLVGILVAVPIYARSGYLLEDVLRDPAAPNGTVELMFDHAMRALGAEGCRHATFGLAPLAGVHSRLLRLVRRLGRLLYDFEGLHRFKLKLGPCGEDPVWIAYPRGESRLPAVLDVLRAFAGGGLLRFGLRTLAHRRRRARARRGAQRPIVPTPSALSAIARNGGPNEENSVDRTCW